MNSDKPILSKQAFWDVDMDQIDYEKNALNVIERVIQWGTFEDFIQLRNFYNEDTIRKEIVKTKWIGDKEINFCCLVFKLKIADFKYYKKKSPPPNSDFAEKYNPLYPYNSSNEFVGYQ